MTNEQLIAKFNPKSATKLTAEELETLRGLSDEQIDVLADAYPNTPTRRAYLRLYDTSLPADKQLYQLSTWQNLRNVRKFSSKKNLRPYDFLASVSSHNAANKKVPTSTVTTKKVIVDMTAKEAAAELTKKLGPVKTVEMPAAKPELPQPIPEPIAETPIVNMPQAEIIPPAVETPAPATTAAPVDNTAKGANKKIIAGGPKSVAGKAAAAKATPKVVAPKNVENAAEPADQQFTNGE